MPRKFDSLLELPEFEQKPDEISRKARELIQKSRAKVDEFASRRISADQAADFIKELDIQNFEESEVMDRIYLLQNVSPSEEIRKAAQDAFIQYQNWSVEKAYHRGLFLKLKELEKFLPSLSGEEALFLKESLKDYRRLGLELPEEKQNQLKELQKQLSQIETDFSTHINDYEDELWVKPQELEGLEARFIETLEKNESGEVKITLQYPHYLPVMEFCSNEKIRKALLIKKYNTASQTNTALLDRMISMRDELANLLGYKSYNHFVIEDRMAKAPEKVKDFLAQFERRLRPKAEEELKTLKALKAAQTGEKNPEIEIWDYSYYLSLYKKKNFQIDLNALKEFFPLHTVLPGMLGVMGDLFQLDFEEKKSGTFPTWHEDVQLFIVKDRSSKKALGAFYLDAFPRPGKYGHAAAFTLIPGYERKDGKYQAPVGAMVCNFPKQTPSLLSHSEVETLFHEFGHALHGLLTNARFCAFSGTSVAWDFVESPSQVLENWCWNAEILKRLSPNPNPFTKEFVERMEAAHKAGNALFYLRQLSFAKADLAFHTEGRVKNSAQIMQKVIRETFLPLPEHTSFEAGWGHMVGYAAGYYGYAWADVMAADMFSIFKKKGILDPESGVKLRTEIYEPGSSRDEQESLESFLGRPLSDAAFFENLGLRASERELT